jgi:formylglycine-generating enzyme required for sulfatase activity
VNDWYQSNYYSSSPASDPQGPVSGTYRLVRGGDWDTDVGCLRVASRDFDALTDQVSYIGFRCVGN